MTIVRAVLKEEPEKQSTLSEIAAYEQGVKDALTMLAIWKRGSEVLGIKETPLKIALANIKAYMGQFYDKRFLIVKAKKHER